VLIGIRFRLDDLTIEQFIQVLSGTPACWIGRHGENFFPPGSPGGHR
jgi:hypothetical protein